MRLMRLLLERYFSHHCGLIWHFLFLIGLCKGNKESEESEEEETFEEEPEEYQEKEEL